MECQQIPYSFAKRHQIVVSQIEDGRYEVCATPQTRLEQISEAQRFTQRLLPVRLLTESEFRSQMIAVYESGAGGGHWAEDLSDELDLSSIAESIPETEDLLEQEDDAPIIRLINAVLREAIRLDASDVHIETFEKRLIVRFRIDGVLREILEPQRSLAPMLVSRIKVMAKLDIAEKRVPQDGRISLKIGEREVDIRVSTMPSSDGERIVLRLLDKQAGRLDFAALGMKPNDREGILRLLNQPHGILLVTGPTGSGKTTTLYAGLREVLNGTKNIMTIEDPIEYNLEGIGQTQVNLKADMTFARGLRAMLRQDPDIVMVGEIRDMETAEVAVQASLTGHLVLSTLHTNSAVGAISRLEDMGIEPFLLASSMIGALAQRLVRVLCPECKKPHTANESECQLLGVDCKSAPHIYRAVGCDACGHQGYRGRRGIYELVVIDDAFRELIHARASDTRLTEQARTLTPSIFQSGCALILDGDTSIDEVLRVTQER